MNGQEERPEEAGFAQALRGAVADKGISLEQLRRALADEGITVSVATLSYWQSGRSRPERATSLAAIGPLEACLDLPRGFLASRLPSSRRRGHDETYGQGVLTPDREGRRSAIDRAVEQLGLRYDDLAYVSVHDRVRLDPSRRESAYEARLLLRAEADGVDRYPVWLKSGDPEAFPVVRALTNCRVGRVREFREEAGVAVEMLLDRPLQRGETVLVEHRLTLVGAVDKFDHVWRRVTTDTREVVMEVTFDPDDLPTELYEVRKVDVAREERARIVRPTVQAHFVDQPAGVYGMWWKW